MNIEKRWNLEEMKIRIENLKKITSSALVSIYYANAKAKTDNELDALYITYYALKNRLLKYNRGSYGRIKTVNYARKYDWNQYIDFHILGSTECRTPPSFSYSAYSSLTSTYSNYDSFSYYYDSLYNRY